MGYDVVVRDKDTNKYILRYILGKKEELNPKLAAFLNSNKVVGVMPFREAQEVRGLEINLDGATSLGRRFTQGPVSLEEFKNYVQSIYISLYHLAKNNVSPNFVLFDKDRVFTDSTRKLVNLSVFPVSDLPAKMGVFDFFIDICNSAMADSKTTDEFIKGLSKVAGTRDLDSIGVYLGIKNGAFIGKEVKKEVKPLDSEVRKEVKPVVEQVKPEVVAPVVVAPVVTAPVVKAPVVKVPVMSGGNLNMPDISDATMMVIEDDGLTEVMESAEGGYYGLQRLSTGIVYKLEGHVIVGSDYQGVTIQVDGNRVVSRKHMEIIADGIRVVISDLNSTNGTFLNGERLSPGVQRDLLLGDEVRLGNESFRVVEV